MKVDLTLAVNYLPACTCLGKVLVFMLTLIWVPEGNEVDGLVLLAAMLYMDRLITRNIIFDANAILLAIFFANVHAGVRAASTHKAYQGLVDGMFLCWAIGSVVLICEPERVKQAINKRTRASKIVPVMLMLVIVVAISHFHTPMEPGVVRCCRALAFTLLSFAWIYIVGVRSQHGIEYLKENSCQFVARLSPLLYASQWIAVAFSIGAAGGFTVQYMHMSANEAAQSPYQHAPQQDTVSSPLVSVLVQDLQQPAPTQHAPQLHNATQQQQTVRLPDEEEEELFRQARMQSMATGKSTRRVLDPIWETPGAQ